MEEEVHKTETEKMLEFIAVAVVMKRYLERVVETEEVMIPDVIDLINKFSEKEGAIQLAIASLEKGMIKYQ